MFNYLKQNNNSWKTLISCLLIVGVVVAFSSDPKAAGQTADDLSQQKQDKQAQLDAVLKKIADYSTEIKQAQSQANTLKNALNIINLQIAETTAQIEATSDKIDAANLEIADVTDKIVQTQASIAKEKTVLKTLVSDINDLDQRSPLEIALENDNFQQFLDQVQYVSSIQEQSQEALTKIKQLEADLQIRQADLKAEKSSLDDLLAQLDLTKSGLADQRTQKQQILDQTKGQEKAYQRLLTDSQGQEEQLAKEINDLDDAISAKLGNKRLSAIHGLLAYPMEGTLTQGYGNTGFTALGYTFHNGIDLAGPPGTPIYAAGDGTVAATGTGSGAYGNWVAIKHDTGKFAAHPIITLYGHMESFRMSTGQTVKLGDLVGFEGNTGNTTRLLYGPHRGYHLHFTVFDADGFGVADGAYPKIYGPYQVPYGATYNPLDFL
ncbi:MAG: peptidoglycan DD-metalloendopeptidase family protein [Candidatus Doudnabacteria bacterium]